MRAVLFFFVYALSRVLACCPSASGLALAWERALFLEVGRLGLEARVLIVFVVLSLTLGALIRV